MNFNLTLIMQAVAFHGLHLVLRTLHQPPLMRAIETRQKQIADGLAAGEQGLGISSAPKRDAQILTEAKAKSAEIVAIGEEFKADDRAGQDRRQGRGRPYRRRRQAEIQQELARAKEQLRDAVADLAVAGATRILKKDVDVKARRTARAVEARALSRTPGREPWPN